MKKVIDIYDRLFVLILRAQRSPPSASLYFLNKHRGCDDNLSDRHQILRVIRSVPLTIVWLSLTFDCVTCKNLVLFVNCIAYAYITCYYRQNLDYRLIAIFINFYNICKMKTTQWWLYSFVILRCAFSNQWYHSDIAKMRAINETLVIYRMQPLEVCFPVKKSRYCIY